MGEESGILKNRGYFDSKLLNLILLDIQTEMLGRCRDGVPDWLKGGHFDYNWLILQRLGHDINRCKRILAFYLKLQDATSKASKVGVPDYLIYAVLLHQMKHE